MLKRDPGGGGQVGLDRVSPHRRSILPPGQGEGFRAFKQKRNVWFVSYKHRACWGVDTGPQR